nr:MAG TPA: hypothetical protein [Caudoviricetes sp.]
MRNSSLSANTSKSSIKESFLSLLETVNEDLQKYSAGLVLGFILQSLRNTWHIP